MQKIFEKFRSGAKILATESNAEVEIVVKYSFKEKPETSSALPNERNGRTDTTRDMSNKSSHKRHSHKSLVEPSATYVQIRNPGSRSPPISIKTGKKIRVSKSQRSTAQSSSSRVLPLETVSSTSGHIVHNKLISSPKDVSNISSRRAKKSQSMVSCVIGKFVDGEFKPTGMQVSPVPHK